MRHAVKSAILIAVFILQNSLTNYIEVLGIIPSFVIVLMVAYSLSSTSVKESLIYSLSTGVLMDVMWGRVFGLWSVLFMYAGVAVYFAGEYLYKHTTSKAVILTFLSTLFIETVFYLASFTLFGDSEFWYELFRVIIPAGAYNAILQAVFYGLIRKAIPKEKRGEEA